MHRIAALFIPILLALFGALAPAGEKAKAFEHSAEEKKLFELTNEERKKKDIAPLVLNAPLSKIARAHSLNMATQGKMEHKLDDKTPFDRLRDASFNFLTAAENIAAGENGITLPMIMKAWMESKGHSGNILEAEYTDIGVGIARDKEGKIYFTQVFARTQK